MNPVFDVLLRIGKARLARALNVMGVLKPPRRDKLDKKSQEQLVQALWLLEHLKNQPELSPGDLVSFGACAAVIGHFAPFSELLLAHHEVASSGGRTGGVTRTKNAEKWHDEARPHLVAAEKENPGLSPKKLAPLVISLCSTKIGVDAMTKFIRKEREARK
jgi:hypothetical protein